jgi:HK97 gp10 family phage protein
MARNTSVERFKKLTEDLRKEVHDMAVAELNAQATALAALIESVAPEHEGHLKASVRVIPGKTDTVVRIVAGDNTTLRTSPAGVSYQYPRADEFGTINMPPKPFFYPTYRLRKKKIISAMKRKITASIKKRSSE